MIINLYVGSFHLYKTFYVNTRKEFSQFFPIYLNLEEPFLVLPNIFAPQQIYIFSSFFDHHLALKKLKTLVFDAELVIILFLSNTALEYLSEIKKIFPSAQLFTDQKQSKITSPFQSITDYKYWKKSSFSDILNQLSLPREQFFDLFLQQKKINSFLLFKALNEIIIALVFYQKYPIWNEFLKNYPKSIFFPRKIYDFLTETTFTLQDILDIFFLLCKPKDLLE